MARARDMGRGRWGRCLSFGVIVFLAQAPKQANDVIPWVIGLVAALLILFGGALLVRKWMLKPDSSPASDEGLLEGLRRLRDEGKLSDAEYQQARKQMVGKAAERMKTSESSNAVLEAAKARSHNRKPNGPAGSA